MKNMFINTLLCLCVPVLMGCNDSNKLTPDDAEKKEMEYLSEWKEGYMDIHQISTGRGNAAFLQLPDGTTMLVDMGDLGASTKEIMPAMPSSTFTPAEWVAKYINNFAEGAKLDYCLITHYHNDHMGNFDELAKDSPKGYKLQGITKLADLIEIDKIVDRSWPGYTGLGTTNYENGLVNYSTFMTLRSQEGKANEKFVTGSKSQFVLLKNPSGYSNFSVRNVVGNLDYWTGTGDQTAKAPFTSEDENEYSCGIRISYGKFDWFSAGDIKKTELESAVAAACGPTEAVVCNHHAYSDAMWENFVRTMKANAWIIPVWDYYHPQPKPLGRMLSQDLYEGARTVFSAGLMEANRVRLGEDGEKIKAGHVVIRVYEGGKQWQVFVLNDASESYEVIYKTEILNAK